MDEIRRIHPDQTTAFKSAVAWFSIVPPSALLGKGGKWLIGVGNAKQFSTPIVEPLFYYVLVFHHITPI